MDLLEYVHIVRTYSNLQIMSDTSLSLEECPTAAIVQLNVI